MCVYPRIGQLLGRRHDRGLGLENVPNLRHHRLDGRISAEDGDVRLPRLEGLHGIAGDLDADPAAHAGDVAEVSVHLRRIDIDAADDLDRRLRNRACRFGGQSRQSSSQAHIEAFIGKIGKGSDLGSPGGAGSIGSRGRCG